MRHGAGGAGTGEGVEDEVAGVGAKLNYPFKKSFWFWSIKRICTEKGNYFFFCFLVMPYFFVFPPGPGSNSFMLR